MHCPQFNGCGVKEGLTRQKRVFPTFVDLWKSQWREEGAQANPLKEELATLEQYVRLEEVRLGCNVAWTICCPKEEWLNTLIPSLLLQPAIENAIWHGFNGRAGNHAIEIEVMRSQVKSSSSWLDIVVRDNGAGLSDVQGSSRKRVVSQGLTHHLASDRRPSVGLTVTRNRLIEHHPDACFLLKSGATMEYRGHLFHSNIVLRKEARPSS